MENCDCLDMCGDDPRLSRGTVKMCQHETSRIKQAKEEAKRKAEIELNAARYEVLRTQIARTKLGLRFQLKPHSGYVTDEDFDKIVDDYIKGL